MADDPLTQCPECEGPVKKIMSRNSFQLKGGGWYADGYSATKPADKKESSPAVSEPPCKTGGSCPCAAKNT
jgi:predicted nucleic acid-binding Zn ribbon protein